MVYRAHNRNQRRPYPIPPPGVMTAEEIRYWLNVLTRKYGWSPIALGRVLGMKHPQGIYGKRKGTHWIYRTEQLRFSRVLKRIIDGELIFVPWVRKRVEVFPAVPGHAVLADHPVPLPQPVRYEFDFKAGMLQRILWRKRGTSTIPSFKKALQNAGRWRDCTFPEEERRERDT